VCHGFRHTAKIISSPCAETPCTRRRIGKKKQKKIPRVRVCTTPVPRPCRALAVAAPSRCRGRPPHPHPYPVGGAGGRLVPLPRARRRRTRLHGRALTVAPRGSAARPAAPRTHPHARCQRGPPLRARPPRPAAPPPRPAAPLSLAPHCRALAAAPRGSITRVRALSARVPGAGLPPACRRGPAPPPRERE